MADRRKAERRKRTEWQWTWHWKSVAAVVYLAICVCDFLVMPLYREYTYTRIPIYQMVELARTMDDGAERIEALRILKEDRAWTPITNDMFHIAFGAILGVAALPNNKGSSSFGRDPGPGFGRRYEYEDEDPFEDDGLAPDPDPTPKRGRK